ncbi:hypothetical protein cypCar_00032264 [Cyprinus carpio]|nr:hypothetical protein cypCar_00032264 [Cyprinus carpio]
MRDTIRSLSPVKLSQIQADLALLTIAMRKFCEDKISSSLQPFQNSDIQGPNSKMLCVNIKPALLLKGDILVKCYHRLSVVSKREYDRFLADATVELLFSSGLQRRGGEVQGNEPGVSVDYGSADPIVRWDSYENFNIHQEDSVEVTPSSGIEEPENRLSPKFVQNSSKYWNKPGISRDQDLERELQELQSGTNTSTAADLLKQGAACNVLYLNTGPQDASKATECTLPQDPRPSPTVIHFKVCTQGITLTDNQRRMFGFVARRSSELGNVCHLFAELDSEQPATAIVNFINKVMLGPQQLRK